jgi:D-arabinitol dehydrogenase (NADP+)
LLTQAVTRNRERHSPTAQTIDYLESGLVKTQGIVNKVFRLEEYGEALESIRNKTAIKAAIVFDD